MKPNWKEIGSIGIAFIVLFPVFMQAHEMKVFSVFCFSYAMGAIAGTLHPMWRKEDQDGLQGKR